MTAVAALPTTADVLAAAQRVAPYVRRTPVLRVEVDGRPLVLKLEQLQLTGTFKLRGALNALLSGPPPAAVVTASGGNHGLGVAMAARLLGIPATVYVPESAPEVKTRRVTEAGALLVRAGSRYADAADAALAHAQRSRARFLHAYDDAHVVAGQGTVGLEVVADVPQVDVVAVAAGGGGLAAGVALAVCPRLVVAVEPAGCCSVHAGMAAGIPVDSPVESLAASALGATAAGAVPLAVLRACAAESVLVTEDELIAARCRLWEEFRLAVEPAAAVPFAAWLAGRVPGELPCVVLCGANSPWTPE